MITVKVRSDNVKYIIVMIDIDCVYTAIDSFNSEILILSI